MNINQLKYFQAVCEANSVTKAAEKLHISQPSISNAIKCLENELDVSLFLRDNKKLTLSQTGEFFLEKINCILNHLDQLSIDIKTFDEKRKNTIKIGISVMDINAFFKTFLQLQKQYPRVQFQFSEGSKREVREQINEGALDYGIIVLEEEDLEAFAYAHLLDMRIDIGTKNSIAVNETSAKALYFGQSYEVGIIWREDNFALANVESLPEQLAKEFN